jgi:ankyrin repeat protein
MGCVASVEAASGRAADTALLRAATNGDTAGMKAALDAGAGVDAASKARAHACASAVRGVAGPASEACAHRSSAQKGCTPLMVAAAHGRQAAVELLVAEHAASLEAQQEVRDSSAARAQRSAERTLPPHAAAQDGWTALLWAAQGGHVRTLEFLASKGANIKHAAQASGGPACMSQPRRRLQARSDRPLRSQNGATALTVACDQLNADTVTCLLQLGADIESRDSVRTPPRTLALRSAPA